MFLRLLRDETRVAGEGVTDDFVWSVLVVDLLYGKMVVGDVDSVYNFGYFGYVVGFGKGGGLFGASRDDGAISSGYYGRSNSMLNGVFNESVFGLLSDLNGMGNMVGSSLG